MDKKRIRLDSAQPGTVFFREQAETPPPPLLSPRTGPFFTRQPKLLSEVQQQDCASIPGQESSPAGNLPMHVLQHYRDEEKVPMFLMKMWNILEDPSFRNIICWDKSGYSFHILDPHLFCRVVLPQFFKHNNLNSLIRQLNMYGFRKMTPIEKSSLTRSESDQDHLEFSHPNFIQQHPDLLVNIKRKTPGSRNNENNAVTVSSKEINYIVDEIRQLRDKQRTMENKMAHLVKENESMWQQVSHLRNQHVKQQHVVHKLVQFLVALVQPSQKPLKKRNLLAIDEINTKRGRLTPSSSSQSSQPPSNLAEIIDRLQREIFDNEPVQTKQNSTFIPHSDQGPIIADVTDEPESSMAASSSAPTAVVSVTGSTGSQPTSLAQIPTNSAILLNPISMSPSLDRQISEELAEYLNGQEQTIDNCRDILGNFWDSILTDGVSDEATDQRPLMLEGGDPLLALDEPPNTPDLLTPSTSPYHSSN
ncbi:unnamed protein product [Thelazia callipaeda]|uniref:HSF_DOMAIN domain-containing protein n=1 Tax=Thelazia callipaeda TaxID=103827 RepID=A0A0N5CVS0_THECL|nr:unnamed protein product [Thelazia callipaeda]